MLTIPDIGPYVFRVLFEPSHNTFAVLLYLVHATRNKILCFGVILIKKILSVVNSDMFVLVVTKFRMINAPRATRDVGREIFQIEIASSSRVIDIYLSGGI